MGNTGVNLDILRLRQDIARLREDISDIETERDDLSGDLEIKYEQLEELETELESYEEDALNEEPPVTLYLDELLKGLQENADYSKETDQAVMADYGIEDAGFIILMSSSGMIYSCTDPYPTQDSIMTLAGRWGNPRREECRKAVENTLS